MAHEETFPEERNNVRVLKSKRLVIAIALLNFLMLAGIVGMAFKNYLPPDFYRRGNMFLEGEYSIDGGEWKKIDPGVSVNERFHTIRIRGTIPSPYNRYAEIAVYAKNIWFKLTTAEGQLCLEHKYRTLDEECEEYYQYNSRMDDAERQQFRNTLTRFKPYAFNLPDTPGYVTQMLYLSGDSATGITPDTTFIFEAENPYDNLTMPFSDSIFFSASKANGVYLILVKEYIPGVILFSIVSCLGLFFFPAVGVSMSRLNYKYLSFGLLCFFWGCYMTIRSMSGIMNYWVLDPTLCMFVDKMSGYLFVIALLIYFRTNMRKDLTKAVSGIILVGFVCFTVVCAILHLRGAADLVALSQIYNIIIVLSSFVTVISFGTEISDRADKLMFLLFWCPMEGAMVIMALARFTGRTEPYFLMVGLSVTIVVHIVQMMLDIRKGYRERLHYERVKRELYEARVSVMTSQIRPHFIYNALTSIAMLCILDPPAAQTAVITFAKYLRENMDSMNQTEPVPFKREYEHLKKYLYIEKLRFGDKLNVEYDIGTESFVLPLLSLQPLVENAVKHGVGQKKEGGTVSVSTFESENAYIIVVKDDGTGFDTGQTKVKDNRSHMGIENTRMRIKEMCGGDVVIKSIVGEGTTATIILPREGQKDENTVS